LKVKCEAVTPGSGPSETVVAIRTTGGYAEEVVVHTSLVERNEVSVAPLGRNDKENSVLIQLPQESVGGNWRIWVPNAIVA
jgi:hypothetical protein